MTADILDSVWILVGTLLVTCLLGFIAGFSPTLYAVQIGISRTKRYRRYALALILGVIASFSTLLVLFQFFQPEILIRIIHSTLDAVFVSRTFNVFIGAVFVGGGIWYIRHTDRRLAVQNDGMKKTGTIALFGLGYLRSITSLSSIMASFVASNIITQASGSFGFSLLFLLVFLVVSVLPFALLLVITERHPTLLNRLLTLIKRIGVSINIRLIGAAIVMIVGAGILLVNAAALFYS